MTRYCPAGDGAFEDWVERCPECGLAVIDRAPEDAVAAPAPTGDDPIIYLATVPNEPLARMWADVLADAGIRTLVKAVGPGFGAWGSVATFEHELYVLRSRLAEAKAIVRELEGDGPSEDIAPGQ